MQFTRQIQYLHSRLAPDSPIETFVDAVRAKAIGLSDKSQFYAPIRFSVQICGEISAPAGAIRVDVPVHANPNWLADMKKRFAGMIGLKNALSNVDISFKTINGKNIAELPVDDLYRVGKLNVYVGDKKVRLPNMPEIPVEYSVCKEANIQKWVNQVASELPEVIAQELCKYKTEAEIDRAVRGDGSVVRLISAKAQALAGLAVCSSGSNTEGSWENFLRVHHMNSPDSISPQDAQQTLARVSSEMLGNVRRFIEASHKPISAYLQSVEAKQLALEIDQSEHYKPLFGKTVAQVNDMPINAFDMYHKIAEDALASPLVHQNVVATIYNRPIDAGCRWETDPDTNELRKVLEQGGKKPKAATVQPKKSVFAVTPDVPAPLPSRSTPDPRLAETASKVVGSFSALINSVRQDDINDAVKTTKEEVTKLDNLFKSFKTSQSEQDAIFESIYRFAYNESLTSEQTTWLAEISKLSTFLDKCRVWIQYITTKKQMQSTQEQNDLLALKFDPVDFKKFSSRAEAFAFVRRNASKFTEKTIAALYDEFRNSLVELDIPTLNILASPFYTKAEKRIPSIVFLNEWGKIDYVKVIERGYNEFEESKRKASEGGKAAATFEPAPEEEAPKAPAPKAPAPPAPTPKSTTVEDEDLIIEPDRTLLDALDKEDQQKVKGAINLFIQTPKNLLEKLIESVTDQNNGVFSGNGAKARFNAFITYFGYKQVDKAFNQYTVKSWFRVNDPYDVIKDTKQISAHHPWNAQIHHTLQPMADGAYPAYYNLLHTKQDMSKNAEYKGDLVETYKAYHMFAGLPISPPGLLIEKRAHSRSRKGTAHSRRMSKDGEEKDEKRSFYMKSEMPPLVPLRGTLSRQMLQPVECGSCGGHSDSDDDDKDKKIKSRIGSSMQPVACGSKSDSDSDEEFWTKPTKSEIPQRPPLIRLDKVQAKIRARMVPISDEMPIEDEYANEEIGETFGLPTCSDVFGD